MVSFSHKESLSWEILDWENSLRPLLFVVRSWMRLLETAFICVPFLSCTYFSGDMFSLFKSGSSEISSLFKTGSSGTALCRRDGSSMPYKGSRGNLDEGGCRLQNCWCSRAFQGNLESNLNLQFTDSPVQPASNRRSQRWLSLWWCEI